MLPAIKDGNDVFAVDGGHRLRLAQERERASLNSRGADGQP